MPKQIIIAEQHHIAAVFWEDQIQEMIVSTGNQQVGDTYLGIVENVIPGIDAAFVNIGDAERNGFIHVTDLGPLRLKKTAGAITELLTPQQKVLVQVMKEPTGNKGPRLTGNVSLPGRYLVLMPHGKGVNLSRRIKNENERNRLRALAILTKPAGMGVLVRTEADGKGEDAIIEDLDLLVKQWETIQQQSSSSRAPALLNRDDDFIQKVLREMYTSEVNRIVVDSQTGLKRVRQNLLTWSGGKAPEGVLIDHHQSPQPILEYFRINAAIKEALKPRVDLPSGGYIIIESTEALTVVDVNSGSFTRSATARETVLWTNSEAATEIARQLRLRNIGGVVIVDFIDMDTRKDQLKLLEHFNKALKSDKARPQIAQLSELGLVELTRKRQGKNLYELFGEECPTCGGLGHLVHLPGTITPEEVEVASAILPSPIIKSVEKLLLDPEFDFEPEIDSLEETSESIELSSQEVGNSSRRRRRRALRESGFTEELALSNGATEIQGIEKEPEIIALPERSKERPISLRQPRKEENNLEQIYIEMPELEQNIYALMGVSPLIRLNREFKDPKSVVVTLSLPGQGINEPTPEIEEKQLEIAPPPEEEVEELILEVEEIEEKEVTEENDHNNDAELDYEEENPRPSIRLIRRHRRRSSAVETQD